MLLYQLDTGWEFISCWVHGFPPWFHNFRPWIGPLSYYCMLQFTNKTELENWGRRRASARREWVGVRKPDSEPRLHHLLSVYLGQSTCLQLQFPCLKMERLTLPPSSLVCVKALSSCPVPHQAAAAGSLSAEKQKEDKGGQTGCLTTTLEQWHLLSEVLCYLFRLPCSLLSAI